MTQTVTVDEAQNKLQDLLAQALAGNEVIITEPGTSVARLVPVVAHSQKRSGRWSRRNLARHNLDERRL